MPSLPRAKRLGGGVGERVIWIHPKYRSALAVAGADAYETLAALAPTDHGVEKQGRSSGRYQLTSGGEVLSVYVKKYFRLPWWQRWIASTDGFPGPRELANLRRAAALGIAVAEPVAAGADRRHPCKSLLVVSALEGYVPLHEFIPTRFAGRSPAGQRALKRAVTERLAAVVGRLHVAHLYHRDLYLCHFFFRETPTLPAAFDLVLIDLMRLKHSQRPRWRIKDLGALLFSSYVPGVTRTDRLRFFTRYLGTRRLDAPARRLLRRIERKADRYRRHNAAGPAAHHSA